jgi:hypothetical protein
MAMEVRRAPLALLQEYGQRLFYSAAKVFYPNRPDNHLQGDTIFSFSIFY